MPNFVPFVEFSAPQIQKDKGGGLGSKLGGLLGGIAGSFIPIPVLGTAAGAALGSALGGAAGGAIEGDNIAISGIENMMTGPIEEAIAGRTRPEVDLEDEDEEEEDILTSFEGEDDISAAISAALGLSPEAGFGTGAGFAF